MKLPCITSSEWKYGLILEAECCETENKKFDNTTVCNNEGVSNVSDHLCRILEDKLDKKKGLVIMGYQNSRAGCETESDECESYDEERNYSRDRLSEDTVVNTEGKELISLCNGCGLRILNGSIEGGRGRNLTYVREVGSLVLGYIIVKEDEGNNPTRFLKTVTRIESDHLPVTFGIKLRSTGKTTKKKSRRKKLLGEKLIWNKNKIEEYQNKLDELQDLKEEYSNSEERWGRLLKNIKTGAKETGLFKKLWEENENEVFKNKISIDGKNQRQVVWKSLKRFMKYKK